MSLSPDGSLAKLGRGYVKDIALSSDGSSLVVANDLGLWMYSVDTRELIKSWQSVGNVESVTFSNCGEWIATGGWKGSSIIVWDVENGDCLFELARNETGCNSGIIFSPDRRYLAVCGSWRYKRDYFSVEIYSLHETPQDKNGPVRLESTYTYAGDFPLAFCPDSTLLAFGAPTGVPLPFHTEGYPINDENRNLTVGHVAVCDAKTGQHLTTLSGFKEAGSVCFSPDGKFVAVSDDCGPIRVWSVPDDLSPNMPPWHLHKVYQNKDNGNTYSTISYSPDGMLRTVDRSIYDTIVVRERDQDRTLYEHLKTIGHLTSDFLEGTYLAFAGDYDVNVWKFGEEKSHCVSQMHTFPSHLLRFSQDGLTLIAMHRLDGIFSWDIRHSDQPPKLFRPIVDSKPNSYDSDTYFSIDLSPEGKQFVTSGKENTIYLWELGFDTPIAAFTISEKVCAATFSHSANLIACNDEVGNIYIWDVTTKEQRDTYYIGIEDGNSDLTFSPNGAYLACSPYHLYDVYRRKPVNSFASKMVEFQAFSPDSDHIWNDGGSDDEITLWNIHSGQKILSLNKSAMWSEKHVSSFALSECGRYVACSPITHENDVSIDVWDIYNGPEMIATITVPNTCNGCVLAFSPDNKILAIVGYSGDILLWDLTTYLSNA